MLLDPSTRKPISMCVKGRLHGRTPWSLRGGHRHRPPRFNEPATIEAIRRTWSQFTDISRRDSLDKDLVGNPEFRCSLLYYVIFSIIPYKLIRAITLRGVWTYNPCLFVGMMSYRVDPCTNVPQYPQTTVRGYPPSIIMSHAYQINNVDTCWGTCWIDPTWDTARAICVVSSVISFSVGVESLDLRLSWFSTCVVAYLGTAKRYSVIG
jgi:hypothetical protein